MPKLRKYRRDNFARYTDGVFAWIVNEIIRRYGPQQSLAYSRIIECGMAYAAYHILGQPYPQELDSGVLSFFQQEVLPRIYQVAPNRHQVRWMVYDLFVCDGIPGRPLNPEYQRIADRLKIDVKALNHAYRWRLKRCHRKMWSPRF